ncbi:RC-LH1 core complex protein PufX [Octadecabacter sp.]|nr:RC-LH1 core complex protein PufX [Octadecabacter sp.]
MSDQNHHDDYLRTGNRQFRLTADITTLMLKGAGYALVFCFIIGVAYFALVGLSNLLPEDSKFAPDPTPTSMIIDGANGARALI